MLYTIPLTSPLGQRLTQHFAVCDAANRAADHFARTLHERYPFPELTDQDTLHFSTDCEGGGLLGIQLAHPTDLLTAPAPATILWQSIDLPAPVSGSSPAGLTAPAPEASPSAPAPVPADSQAVSAPTSPLFFPRIERHSTYLRYSQAARLIRANDPDWEFQPPTDKEAARGALCHREEYDRIRTCLTPDNRRALIDNHGNTPNLQTRVTLAHHYTYCVEDLPEDQREAFLQAPIAHDFFPLAKQLYKEWMALPTVPYGTLLSILRPTTTELIKHPHLSWHKDDDQQAYIIDTNLTLPI